MIHTHQLPHRPTSGDPDWSRVLLVEGTAGVGKSTLLDYLVRKHVAERAPRKLRTLYHLTQAHTYGPVAVAEDLATLSTDQDLMHLDQVVAALEWHVRSLTAESRIKLFALVDTLHLTHCHRPGVVTWDDVEFIDQRLSSIGTRLVVLHASPERLWERGIAPRLSGSFINGYAIPRFGRSPEEVHAYFVSEQARIRRLASRTAMDCLEIGVDGDLTSYGDEVYRFWTQ